MMLGTEKDSRTWKNNNFNFYGIMFMIIAEDNDGLFLMEPICQNNAKT